MNFQNGREPSTALVWMRKPVTTLQSVNVKKCLRVFVLLFVFSIFSPSSVYPRYEGCLGVLTVGTHWYEKKWTFLSTPCEVGIEVFEANIFDWRTMGLVFCKWEFFYIITLWKLIGVTLGHTAKIVFFFQVFKVLMNCSATYKIKIK